MILKTIKNKAAKIKMIIFDVDGVMTSGEIIVDDRGDEIKIFDVQDGFGIVLAHRMGLKTGIISARASGAVKARAKDLRIDEIHLDAYPKTAAYTKILKKLKLKDNEVCFIGDDLTDISVLRRVGFSVSVPNARAEVKRITDYVTKNKGGQGAIRELIEFILKAQNKWTKTLKEVI